MWKPDEWLCFYSDMSNRLLWILWMLGTIFRLTQISVMSQYVKHNYYIVPWSLFLTWRPEWDRTVSWLSAAPPRPHLPAALAWAHVLLSSSWGRVCRSWRRRCPPPPPDWHARPTAGLAGPRTATATRDSALSPAGWLDWIYLARRMCNNPCYLVQKALCVLSHRGLHAALLTWTKFGGMNIIQKERKVIKSVKLSCHQP